MLKEQLGKYNIILASASPRRQELFKTLDIEFEVNLKPVLETYSTRLERAEITDYLSQLKAKAFKGNLNSNDLLITSDTIVWHKGKALEKPIDTKDASKMLTELSGITHEVITSVCFTTNTMQQTVNDITKVSFKKLSKEEISYYIKNYKPFDKAGAYGIQDWFGKIAVTHIEGSYFNVMGLPVHIVYKTLNEIIER